MQLTRFDRWLREKFVYETHIQTLRPPEVVPAGIRVVEVPDVPGKRYKHLFVAKSSKVADQLISHLRENSQMYTTQVIDRDAWYVPFIAPKEKSVTWWLFSALIITVSVFFTLMYVWGLAQDPEFRKNFMEALKLLKG
ncbi:MAG: hypothetical protein EOP85_05295 [Verrucomicrobiaceae bacterium]|nr:MAG: hypothetical protein EOP85_05295 [Verrucomicrobiaceae bacterium]